MKRFNIKMYYTYNYSLYVEIGRFLTKINLQFNLILELKVEYSKIK